ncbi:obg-like ATPase 1 isoform X1 [Hippocampus zosterae]|uniref:obg-like ATPase 1 isoform X1 n=1 Tax=Hippocampus zosterae TaxID=109293 RepID=UPI00223DA1B9|nr:obg-like ATPase 1 isoform X1 [Hippocampus zosterae]
MEERYRLEGRRSSLTAATWRARRIKKRRPKICTEHKTHQEGTKAPQTAGRPAWTWEKFRDFQEEGSESAVQAAEVLRITIEDGDVILSQIHFAKRSQEKATQDSRRDPPLPAQV